MALDGLIILIILFSYSFGVIISFITQNDQSFILRLIAVLSVIYAFYRTYNEHNTNRKMNNMFCDIVMIYVIILIWMIITIQINGYMSNMMKTYLLSFGSKAIAGILLGYVTFKNTNYFYEIEKWLEPFSLFYTIVLLFAIHKNTSGYVMDLSINRQTLSYAGAYSIAMLLFVNFNKIKQFKIFNNNYIKYINWIVLIFDFYIIFAGGGRGAFVLALSIFIYYIYKENKYSNKKIIISVTLIVFFILIYYFIGYFQSISSGYSMITSSFANRFTDRSSMQRLELYNLAFQYVKKSMFLGMGAGATAYTIEFYTHNIFIDILLEFGIAGIIISFVIFYKTIFKSVRYSSKSHHIEMLFLFYLCSFIMLQFSGTWYSDTMLWFTVTSILSYKPQIV